MKPSVARRFLGPCGFQRFNLAVVDLPLAIARRPEAVAAISGESQRRRIMIHLIGIGAAGNDFETFLRKLARRNYGDYRRVDP